MALTTAVVCAGISSAWTGLLFLSHSIDRWIDFVAVNCEDHRKVKVAELETRMGFRPSIRVSDDTKISKFLTGGCVGSNSARIVFGHKTCDTFELANQIARLHMNEDCVWLRRSSLCTLTLCAHAWALSPMTGIIAVATIAYNVHQTRSDHLAANLLAISVLSEKEKAKILEICKIQAQHEQEMSKLSKASSFRLKILTTLGLSEQDRLRIFKEQLLSIKK